MWPEDVGRMLELVRDQARVHDRNKKAGVACIGLPYCASCRAAVLLKNDMSTGLAEAWIATQPEGAVVRIDEEGK